MSVNGGAVTQITAAPAGRGGAWGTDGAIVFSPDFQSGLFRVSADGSRPAIRWDVQPDGKCFIATTLPDVASRPLTLITHWTALAGKK